MSETMIDFSTVVNYLAGQSHKVTSKISVPVHKTDFLKGHFIFNLKCRFLCGQGV